MITQSVLYNALFFSYASVLVTFFDVDQDRTAIYIVRSRWEPARTDLPGPALRPHRTSTNAGQDLRPVRTAAARQRVRVPSRSFTATTQTFVWCVIFFFASAGASAAYLTISEVFPQEVRAKAIAVFFAITQVFGAGAPYLFGSLIDRVTARPRVRCSSATSVVRR